MFDPSNLCEFLRARSALVLAERAGYLDELLAEFSVRSLDQWWQIEASFFEAHGLTPAGANQQENDRPPDENPAPVLVRRPPVCSSRSESKPAEVAGPPVTFEVFCEIAGAQAAFTKRGLDPAIEARNHFLLEFEELNEIELYWSRILGADRALARQFAHRMLTHKKRFSDG